MSLHDDLPTPPPATPLRPAGPVTGVSGRVRHAIAMRLVSLTSGPGAPRLNYDTPAGDPGLFGPDAACWHVHGDFTSMMIGGISALLMQSLHPLAMAGVWDHSTFRQDVIGRLRRTATFIGGTTFGNTADAEALLERVRRIHLKVTGTAPDGRPYAAYDPELLTWVHVAETSSFLRSYLVYKNPGFSRSEQDRYYAEVSRIAVALGARDVPMSVSQIDEYLAMMRPALCASERTEDVVRVLRNLPAPFAGARMFSGLLFRAGIDLLPDWSQVMLGLEAQSMVRRLTVRPAVRHMAQVARWSMRNSVAHRARRRALATPDVAAVVQPSLER
ncbi:oxygenase MpaB family protein [Pandoraea communis]|uniref:Histidine kinase n=1 Tax=Pandoraea communis TaxID=2508297 RepID=A0A5E4R7C5_9BURK|nr:oxygenase MpaB family protein [Pandoraea communis]MDM8355955.1 oxygenase MpaB family protein [Pandoraea communis]VVD59240.1 histidine kinase [Pandoraea communis]